MPAIDFVHGVVVRHVGQEYGCLHYVFDDAPGGVKHRREISQHLLSLIFNPAADKLPGLRINSELARHKNHSPATMAWDKGPLARGALSVVITRRFGATFFFVEGRLWRFCD